MATERYVSIAPLLKELTAGHVLSDEQLAPQIASVISYLFDDRLSPEQCASFLTALRLTRLDEQPRVIAACAQAMRHAASAVNEVELRQILRSRSSLRGTYKGGFCDIVGTGGDGHSTFNVSTTASIIASAFLLVAKHGAQSSSSKSGSADVMMAIKPKGPDIGAVTASNLEKIYKHGNYAFLFAKQFHPSMKYVAPVRKEIGFRTIFNILGPLANPLHGMIEAGIYGVYKQSLGPVYADALRLAGAKNAMVVCGAEDLDEISCAGPTNCWMVCDKSSRRNSDSRTTSTIDARAEGSTGIDTFKLQPADFGLPVHALHEVLPGRGPEENAELLIKMLRNELAHDHPTLEFVLMNTAALLVLSGICNEETSQMGLDDTGEVVTEVGPGGGRWKEGVRRARWAIQSGRAWESLNGFIRCTYTL